MNKIFLKKLAKKAFTLLVNHNRAERLIKYISNAYFIDLLELAHSSIGIMKFENSNVSGEAFVLKNVLAPYFKMNKIMRPIVFDVGANRGSYSKELYDYLSYAQLYAFEPNPNTFTILTESVGTIENIQCYNIGFGSKKGESKIFTYKNDLVSEHASVFSEVLLEFHNASGIEELSIKIEVLDDFVIKNQIERINFLKIDTEGFEFEVLKGCNRLLKEDKIDFIQFEFNEMNIVSKVFLKDFYNILNGYKLYRIDSQKLIDLQQYRPINEIFRFQNILAIHNSINL